MISCIELGVYGSLGNTNELQSACATSSPIICYHDFLV